MHGRGMRYAKSLLIVCPAQQYEVVLTGRTSAREGNDVVKLEPTARLTALAIGRDETALPAVPSPHPPAQRTRDVT